MLSTEVEYIDTHLLSWSELELVMETPSSNNAPRPTILPAPAPSVRVIPPHLTPTVLITAIPLPAHAAHPGYRCCSDLKQGQS